MLQQVARRGPVARILSDPQAEQYEVPRVLRPDPAKARRGYALRDLFVNLGGVGALVIGDVARDDLEQEHAEGVDVDLLVVVFVIELRRHEFGRAEDTQRLILLADGRTKAKVPDPQIPRRPVDENIIALQIAMYDGRVLRVQILQPLEYLYRPPLEDLPPYELDLLHEALQRPRAQNFRDEDDPFRLAVDPAPVKADDVGMVQAFQEADLVHDAHALGLGNAGQSHDVPRHLDPLDGVVGPVHVLVRARPELFLEAYVTLGGRLFDDFGLYVGGDVLLVLVVVIVVVVRLGFFVRCARQFGNDVLGGVYPLPVRTLGLGTARPAKGRSRAVVRGGRRRVLQRRLLPRRPGGPRRCLHAV
mmetsp:Transcript_2867/g.7271  ORF Transcript_2867/g.7271 Transcript_2867/m.7271 type:complete len:360 (+) Transcript_2867:2596-3675(+)